MLACESLTPIASNTKGLFLAFQKHRTSPYSYVRNTGRNTIQILTASARNQTSERKVALFNMYISTYSTRSTIQEIIRLWTRSASAPDHKASKTAA